MDRSLLVIAAVLQFIAVVYGLFLLSRRQGASSAWLCLLGAMLSMLTWRLAVLSELSPPPFFNQLIAIWGSTFMVAAMYFFGREVKARRRVEKERDALLDSERAARIEAEKASRAKDEFLATLSHELRSPLAAILGWCAVLRHTRGSPDDIERGIKIVERNARAQARLVDDLLDATRMRAGTLHLEFATVALEAPVRAAVLAARPMADAQSVAIELRCGPDRPKVAGDADRLQQIATNLIVNAIKFTPPGGSVTVTVRTLGAQAELTVADSGEGIDAEFLPQVFARFKQADGSTTRRHGGLGLGLSIVEFLVRLHGGSVRAESEGRGHGAMFTVTLPIVAESGEASIDDNAPGEVRAPPLALENSLEGVRVLVDDDDEDVRSAVCRLLQQHGAQVEVLASGATIEKALRAQQPHVLVIDIGMPDEDGYAVIRRVRGLSAPEGGNTPAISLTAHARNEDRTRALASGFNEHLPKPIDIPELIAAIRTLAGQVNVDQPVA